MWDIYTGQRAPIQFWAGWLDRCSWLSVRFFGVVIGRYYIGVQVFSRDEVVKR
jgi:hypothetical protein